jgi:LuxR family maltose regulon positive regulatory protein
LRYYLNTEAFSEGCGLLGKNGPEAGGVRKLLPVPDDLMISDAFIDNQNAPSKSQAPCLKVYLFGKFRVFQGDQEVPDKRWKSKKAQMIFKYLLFMRCRGYLKKEVLMELLWPEDDPVRTAKRFHVALASLRKTLEPEIARGTPSAYISRSGDGYSIDIGDTGTLDIEEFNAELKLAGAENNPEISIGHYLRAILMYQGDFLEEDLYIPWCDEERERFKEEYLSVLAKIIQFYEHLKDYPTCIDYAGKYLKADKYAENIYQQLMHYYAFIGNKAMMIRMFERCKANMTKELDVPMSRETEAIYQKLMAS